MGVKAPTSSHGGLAAPYAAFLPAELYAAEYVAFDGRGEYNATGRGRAWNVEAELNEALEDFLSIRVERPQQQRLGDALVEAWTHAGELLAGPYDPRGTLRYARQLGGFGRLDPHVACRVPPASANQEEIAAYVKKWGPLTTPPDGRKPTVWDYQFTGPLTDVRRIVGRHSPLKTTDRFQLAVSMFKSIPEDTLLIALVYAALSELTAGRIDYRPCDGCGRWFNEPDYDPNEHMKGQRLQPGRPQARYHDAKCRKAAGERRRRERRKAEATSKD